MASGSNRYIQYTKQDSPKVLPTPNVFKRLRTTGGSGLMNNRTNITSDEIRDDRQIIVSRLGQNQPDVTIPYELSYNSFEELFQGAFGSSWVGGETLTVTADITVGGLLTLSAGEWADYAIQEGDFVLLNSAGNTDVLGYVGLIGEDLTADELTLYVVGTESTPVTTTAETGSEFTLVTGHYADVIDNTAVTLTVDADAGSITASASYWLELGVEPGDKVWFGGFTEVANNGWKKVISATDTVLTFDEILADETKDSGNTEITTSTGFITVGKNLDYFAFEEGFTDITSGNDIDGQATPDGVFHNCLGAYVASMSMNVQPDAIITGDFAFQALTYSGFKNATVATAIQESNINEVFDSFTGDLFIPSAPGMQTVITGLNFTLDNGLIRRYALMDKDAISIGDGRANVSGTLNAYFENADVSNLFEQEQEFAMAIRTEDLHGNSYTFGFPRCKLTNDGRDVSENDVTQNVGFQSLGGLASEKKKTFYMLRQPRLA